MISDLHLAPDGRTRCTTDPAELVGLIERLEGGCDEVVVVGDAFDLLRPRRPRGWRAELERLREQQAALMGALDRCEQVVGNHDYPLRAWGVPEERAYIGGGVKVLCVHGHQWDVWLKKIWGMEEGANFVAGWLERANLEAVSRWMGDVPVALERFMGRGGAAAKEEESALTWRGVREEFERGFDVVALGHTHGLGLWALDGEPERLVVNTGSHAHGWRDAVVCDREEARVWALRDEEVVQVAWREGGVRRWSVRARGEEGFEEEARLWRW